MLKLKLLNETNGVYTVQETIPFINSISLQGVIQKYALIEGYILINESTTLNININKNATLLIRNDTSIIVNQQISSGETAINISETGVLEFECFIEAPVSISTLSFTVNPNIFVNIGEDILIEPFNNSKILSTTTFVNKENYVHQAYNTFDDDKDVITYTKDSVDTTNQTKISENTVVVKVNE